MLSLDFDLFLWVSQDEVENNVSELAILIDIKLADLVESLVLDELSKVQLIKHVLETFEVPLAKVLTVACTSNIKTVEGKNDGQNGKRDTLTFSGLNLYEVVPYLCHQIFVVCCKILGTFMI